MANAFQGQSSPKPLRGLKILVTVLGVGVIAAAALFVWLLIAVATRDGPRPGAAAWRSALDLPAGSVVAGVTASGDTMIVHVHGGEPGRDERLFIVETRSGRTVGVLSLGASR